MPIPSTAPISASEENPRLEQDAKQKHPPLELAGMKYPEADWWEDARDPRYPAFSVNDIVTQRPPHVGKNDWEALSPFERVFQLHMFLLEKYADDLKDYFGFNLFVFKYNLFQDFAFRYPQRSLTQKGQVRVDKIWALEDVKDLPNAKDKCNTDEKLIKGLADTAYHFFLHREESLRDKISTIKEMAREASVDSSNAHWNNLQRLAARKPILKWPAVDEAVERWTNAVIEAIEAKATGASGPGLDSTKHESMTVSLADLENTKPKRS